MPKLLRKGVRDYPLGNAYCLVPIGRTQLVYRQYARRFKKGITVYIDDEITARYTNHRPTGKTGKYLLDRFYDLKLAPLAFKWIKARNKLETNHWVCLYPAHYLVLVEQSMKGMHAEDHTASLFYRGERDTILIAQQEYEGHLKGNDEYDQPSILQSELREWRINRMWFQDAFTRETVFDV